MTLCSQIMPHLLRRLPMPEVVYTYTIMFRSPVGVFTGLGVAGLVDRTMVREADGLPYIPGSSVKGRLRFFADRLLKSGTLPNGYRIHAPHPRLQCERETPFFCRPASQVWH